ncbi:MAG: choice-of-anchor J domain-containing protein [Muribaculaceae bacterium]|nr:choice-of-anchor J domain-containing protein [Muribaculaceae bacterium]
MNKTFTSILALAALSLSMPAMAQDSASELPEFIANLVYETDINNSTDNLRGIYKFKPAENITLDTVYVSTMMNANGGGVFRNDLFQFINYIDAGSYMPVQCAIYECYFAADGTVHWDRPELRYGETVPEEMAAVNGMLVEDPASGTLYGIYEANYGYSSMLARADLTTLTREDIGELNQYYLCLACNYEGRLFGIDDYGVLYEIDTTTGEETEIGDTEVWPENVDQSMCFDPVSGHLWWATTVDGESVLYEIDPATAQATQRGTFPWQERFFALSIAKKAAAEAAPGAVTNLQANFAEGSNAGTVTFIMPTTSVDGEPLTGDLSYHVYANGTLVAEQNAAAGSTVSEELTLPSGNTRFRVYASNAAGEGPDATLTLWIGYDVPATPDNVLLDFDENGKATLTWDAVTTSLNGGYIDANQIAYQLTCYVDGEERVGTSATTEFTMDLSDISERKPCHFGVKAVNGDQMSAEAISNNVATGQPLEVPFREDFDTEEGAGLYTILDTNKDGYTWQWTGDMFGTYVYKYNKEEDADDWFITPLVELEAGIEYRFYFDARPMGKDYPETISAFYGQGMKTENYTQLMGETVIDADQVFTLPFTPEASSTYRMAIHVTSPSTQLNLVLDYIGIESDSPVGIHDINSQPTSGITEVYTIDGRRVSNTHGQHGVFIIRQGSKATKVLK